MKPALDIHASTHLIGSVLVEQPFRIYSDVTLSRFQGGAFSYVSPGCALHYTTIGRYCSIGDDVRVLSRHSTAALTTSPVPYHLIFPAPFNAAPTSGFENLQQTTIGNDVWIGSGALIK